MRVGFILLSCILLAGCSEVLLANQKSISITHDAFTVKDAFKTASVHCQKYGKNAVHTSGVESDGMIISTWECR